MAIHADALRIVLLLVLMTGQAGLTRRHRPLVRLVAGLAARRRVSLLSMQTLLLRVRVAAEAIDRRIRRVVRLVALPAFPFHGCLVREYHPIAGKLLVAAQAGLSRRPQRAVLAQERMTLGAVQVTHLLDLDSLFLASHVVSVTGGANLS